MVVQERIPASGRAAVALRRVEWNALGTSCQIQYMCDDAARGSAFEAAAIDWVEAFEARYSRFRPGSLVSRINVAAGREWVGISDEMSQFLDLCGSLFLLSHGTLDVTALPLLRLWDYKAVHPRIPDDQEILAARRLVGWPKVRRAPGAVFLPEPGMALDFGGWGKEYAVDVVAQIAREHGVTPALVDFGHDLRVLGAPPDRPGWHVGLEDPDRPGGPCWGSVGVVDCGVASSGDYLRGFTINGRRYGHIVDPRTGRPVSNGCRQVTVVAPTCLQAGVLATAAFVLGAEPGVRLIEETPGAEGCILVRGARHLTRGFFRHLVSP